MIQLNWRMVGEKNRLPDCETGDDGGGDGLNVETGGALRVGRRVVGKVDGSQLPI